jgi:hypothetical protein
LLSDLFLKGAIMRLRSCIPLVGAAALAMATACATPMDDKQSSENLAAYGAQTAYPDSVKTDASTTMGCVVEPGVHLLRVLNFGQNSINDADVWVNGTYVLKVDSIPADSYVKLNLSRFYDHDGHSFTDSEATVTKVQLHLGDRMWTLLGPISQ